MKIMQEGKKYDVAGIGNSLLDFIVEVDDRTLEEVNLVKGEMRLIDLDQSKRILNELKNYTVTTAPGGSSANTLAGVSALGGSAVYMGKIGGDANGAIYEQKTGDDGVLSRLSKHDSFATGHAITFITPDGERTFATHLGAALHFRKEDVMDEDIAESKVLHIEGYQLEDPELKRSAVHAMEVAKKHGTKISIDLSDPALVGRHLEAIHSLVIEYVDIVFVNEYEAEAFTGKKGEDALHDIYELCDVAVVKLGEGGSIIKAEGNMFSIPAYPVDMVNTNGAGDMFAAGFLYGLTHDIPYEKAGNIGSFAAAQVVSCEGARLRDDLKEKVKQYIMSIVTI